MASSVSGRALKKTWQVTEKANPFMSKPGTKTTQTRNMNDQIRQPDTPQPSGIAKFFGSTWKSIMGESQTETINWALWEKNLRANIARLINEEEKRQIAFKRMQHRVI